MKMMMNYGNKDMKRNMVIRRRRRRVRRRRRKVRKNELWGGGRVRKRSELCSCMVCVVCVCVSELLCILTHKLLSQVSLSVKSLSLSSLSLSKALSFRGESEVWRKKIYKYKKIKIWTPKNKLVQILVKKMYISNICKAKKTKHWFQIDGVCITSRTWADS